MFIDENGCIRIPVDGLQALVEESFRLIQKRVEVDDAQHFGRGRFDLYAFTFPSHRRRAALEGSPFFPLKIGYTQSGEYSTQGRIAQMMVEPMLFPEPAQLLLTWQCDDGRIIETAVHRELKTRGRHLSDAPGKEWFATNVAELIDVLKIVTGRTAAVNSRIPDGARDAER